MALMLVFVGLRWLETKKVKAKRSFLDSLGLPKPVFRKCFYDGKQCVDPESWFCGEYPFPVDPVDPHDFGSVWKRERVFVPACVRCGGGFC